MTHRLIEKFIKPGEICVRCLLHPMHVKGANHKLQDAALIPKKDDVNVSMLRQEYTTEQDIVNHGEHLAKTIPSAQPQEFKGLLFVTQNIVGSVNQWLHTRFSKLEGVDNLPEKLAELRYAPMVDAQNYVEQPELTDIYTDSPGIDLPHHADLRYVKPHTADCQTEIRYFGREMMKRVRYKIKDGQDDWSEDVQPGSYHYFTHQPKLSIIVPFYNDKKYIQACADSIYEEVKDQSVEVIWVGDTPTDGTSNIVAKFVSEHPESFYMYGQEHCGQGMARNEGLKVARGEYVWFVDADDRICKGSVQIILDAIRGEHDAYMFRTEELNEDGTKRKSTRRYMKCEESRNCKGLDILLQHLSFAPSLMCVFKRDFLIKNHLAFPRYRNLDMEFMPRFLRIALNIQVRPEVIYSYCYHKKKGLYNEEDTRQMLAMYDDYSEYRKDHSDDLLCQKTVAYVQQMILSQIIQLPSKSQFSRLDRNLSITAKAKEIREIVMVSGFSGDSIVERAFWLIARFSPQKANWFSNLKFIR